MLLDAVLSYFHILSQAQLSYKPINHTFSIFQLRGWASICASCVCKAPSFASLTSRSAFTCLPSCLSAEAMQQLFERIMVFPISILSHFSKMHLFPLISVFLHEKSWKALHMSFNMQHFSAPLQIFHQSCFLFLKVSDSVLAMETGTQIRAVDKFWSSFCLISASNSTCLCILSASCCLGVAQNSSRHR